MQQRERERENTQSASLTRRGVERLNSAQAEPPRTCDCRPRTLPFTITFSIALLHRHSRNEVRVPKVRSLRRENASANTNRRVQSRR